MYIYIIMHIYIYIMRYRTSYYGLPSKTCGIPKSWGIPNKTMGFRKKVVIHDLDDLGVPP